MLKRMLLKNYGWTLKTAASGKEATRFYPEVMMELPAAERGIHELDATTCIGCASCARICPNSCIEMVPFKYGSPLKNKKMVFPQIDYGRCLFCGLCVDECPVECLEMGKKITISGWTREGIVKKPGDISVKQFTAKEVADLEAEAARIAAEKKKAAAAKAKEKAAGDKAAGEKPAPKAKKEANGAGGPEAANGEGATEKKPVKKAKAPEGGEA